MMTVKLVEELHTSEVALCEPLRLRKLEFPEALTSNYTNFTDFISNTWSVWSCILYCIPTPCWTESETLIYNSSAGGDGMKARVLKTQMLISYFLNIKTYIRFIKVENTHWSKQSMLHLLENMVAVLFENHRSKRTEASTASV